MNDDDPSTDDPLMDWALHERVGGEQPPDLVGAVRARLHEARIAAPAARLTASQLAAAALVLLGVAVVCGVALWPKPTDVPAAPRQEPAPVHVDPSTDIASLPAGTRAVAATNIHDQKLAALARLRSLEVLTVSNPWNESFGLSLKMTKPRDAFSLTAASWQTIAGFTKLRRLELSGVPYVAMLPPRGSGPPVTGAPVADAFAQLERLPVLESLTLRFLDTPDDMLAVLPRLPSLRHLDLSFDHAFGSAGVDAIAKCRTLRSISLRGCQQLHGNDLALLASLPELEELDLSAIDGIDWRSGSAERDEVEQVSGNGDRELGSSAAFGRELRRQGRSWARAGDRLGLGPTDWTLDALARLPKLRVLDISGGRYVTGTGLAALGRCTTLRDLDAFGIGDQTSAWVASLPPALERLVVGGAHRDDFCVAVAAHLTALRDLTLAACDRITDDGVRAVASMPSLRRLDLRQMRGLTAATIDTLVTATQLEELDLRHDDFVTAEHVARLRAALPRLRVLQASVEAK